MPLTSSGYASDPLAPLAWDLFMATLGLSKLAGGHDMDEEERNAISDLGQVINPLITGQKIDVGALINSRGGPLYSSDRASFAALATIRRAIDSPFSRLRPDAAARVVTVSKGIEGASRNVDPDQLQDALATCELLLEVVNSERPGG
jgi:hypothetical protein